MGVATMPGTAGADPAKAMKPVRGSELATLLDDGDLASLREAVGQSLARLERQPLGRKLVFGPWTVTVAQ